ncbi:MAG: hypothetical protein LBH37_04060 [Oscillospiraceae bacterium]|jgi:hypothetical protein|nr:hypothetical protein [Oscillospiraceae bacterium]
MVDERYNEQENKEQKYDKQKRDFDILCEDDALFVTGGISPDNVVNTPTLLKAEDFSPPEISGVTDVNGIKWHSTLLNSKWVWCPNIPDNIISGLIVNGGEKLDYPEEIMGWPNEYEAGDDIDGETG